jgi:hypothetical protein
MKLRGVEQIADAVLYEGYILYPYRPSATKNQQRFNFGVLYPRQYCEPQTGSDAWAMRTECLIAGNSHTPIEVATIEVKVRWLQMASRESWQEGQERDISTPACSLQMLSAQPYRQEFEFAGDCDDRADKAGRRSETITGELEFAASRVGDNLYQLSLDIRNLVELENPAGFERDRILLRSMISVHSILHAEGGEFVSLLDPPERLKQPASECRNIGTWPVLAGEEGQRDLVLSAPIILYDYPQIAPESAGDMFDGCEIDEILALRILTMTDAEKLEVRNGDDRARRILERTEMLPPEHFQKLHGALRGLRTATRGA